MTFCVETRIFEYHYKLCIGVKLNTGGGERGRPRDLQSGYTST